MKIVNEARMSDRQIARMLRGLDDSQLIAQELVQKGALHALVTLRSTRQPLADMIGSCERLARLISAECRRRQIPVVDDLEVS